MRILFLGDIVGEMGRKAVEHYLPILKEQYQVDFTIVNGENSAHGKGINVSIYNNLISWGADVVTLGNHAFSKKEIIEHFDECPNMIRPANLEPLDVGKSIIIKEVNDKRVAVVNMCGDIFLDYINIDPFKTMDKILEDNKADIYIVDFHAEATSEKICFMNYFKRRVSAIVGTHTHVQTADECINCGCAYISDVGMCGPYESILGRDTDEVINKLVHKEKTHFTPSTSEAMVCGVVIDINNNNRATKIERIQIRP